MIRKSFNLINSSEEKIQGDLRYREGAKNAPVIVICHGFKGFKDWGFFPVLAERLADDGYVTITFNFSRNGIGADPNNFTELEQFAKNTYSHELSDLKAVINTVSSGEVGKNIIDPEKIGLLGHSRGGGITLLYASEDERIQCVATWSAIAKVERYSDEVIKQWEKQGFIEIENKRTNQMMRINKEFLTDIKKNGKKLNILKAASKINIPVLIIHGDNDESVPVSEANEIYEKLNGYGNELEIIEGGTHTFGIRHQVEGVTPEFETVVDLTEIFFDKNLSSI
jgi:dienelactone hydrolase